MTRFHMRWGRFLWAACTLPLLSGLLPMMAAKAAPPPADPDWPCAQRLVPSLTLATVWSGPLPPAGADWRQDEAMEKLIETITPRDTPAEEGLAELKSYVEKLPPSERAQKIPLLAAGLVAATNEERGDVITKLEDLGHRQRLLAKRIEDDEETLAHPPPTLAADDRAGISERHDLLVHSYHDIGETIRYACQVPPELEARLGLYTRLLASYLGKS
jgi:hypothetical protein